MARVLILLAMVVALVATGFAPAVAGQSGGDDLESVRAEVTGTYNYKIGLLEDKKAGTDNADKQAIYAAGIAELKANRDGPVATAETVDALWALNDLAHTIYHETKAAADAVGETPAEKLAKAQQKAADTVEYKIHLLEKWIEGCDDPTAQAIVADGIAQLRALFGKIDAATTADEAYGYKDQAHSIYHATIDKAEKAKGDPKEEEKPKEPTPEEKAAAALKSQRNSTLSLIFKKTELLTAAAEAAALAEVREIYTTAAEDVAGLEDDARAAKTIDELKAISATVMEIYEKAKADAAAVEHGDEDPTDSVNEYLDKVIDFAYGVVHVASETQDRSPETFADLVDAKVALVDAAEAVREAAASEKNLKERWEDLHEAMRDFRRALLLHYLALGEPLVLGDLHVAG